MSDSNDKGLITLNAFIVGVVTGAAAVYLSKSSNRAKVRRAYIQLKEPVFDTTDDISETSSRVINDVREKGRKIASKLEKKVPESE